MKAGDKVEVEGKTYWLAPEPMGSEINEKLPHCGGCAFIDVPCRHIACEDFILVDQVEAVARKLAGEF